MTERYFHGTDAQSAWSIMTRGFSLAPVRWGRGWGNGVYLSGTAEFAASWGPIIIRCQLQRGTRILWYADYDRKVIGSLRRAFGRDIIAPDFWKVLPRNKHFTRDELVQLWHYLVSRFYLNQRRYRAGGFERLKRNYSRLHQQLRQHGYDGVGFRTADWPELLIFNPARVQPLSAHRWSRRAGRTGAPIPVGRLQRPTAGV